MRSLHVRHLAVITPLFLLISLSFVGCSSPLSSNSRVQSEGTSDSLFFGNSENWMAEGYGQYGELPLKEPLTAEVVVGTGEEFEDIQEALDAGYSCIYLKKQRFNVTKPITPPKEDFYILGNGAEIYAVTQLTSILDIRNVRYAHLDGLFINGNGLAEKCIDAARTTSQVPVHQIRNCKIWGAKIANVDLTGCEDSLIFNCWIDGRKVNDTPDAVTKYGVKIGDFSEDYRTGGQINLIHCLMGFHRKADIYAKNIAQLKLANCLLSSKNVWSAEFEAHIIVEGGTGENALLPTLELTNCWVENGLGGDVPNVLIRKRMISKLTIIGGMFYADKSPNIYSALNPCAETIVLVGALFEHNPQYKGYNIVAPTLKLVSIGNSYNWHGIDKTNLATYLIFDRDDANVQTSNEAP